MITSHFVYIVQPFHVRTSVREHQEVFAQDESRKRTNKMHDKLVTVLHKITRAMLQNNIKEMKLKRIGMSKASVKLVNRCTEDME